MKKTVIITLLISGGLLALTALNSGTLSQWAQAAGDGEAKGEVVDAAKPQVDKNAIPLTAPNETVALEIKRQQIAEREAALSVKEEELKKLSASLDARVLELDAAKKGLDESYAKLEATRKKMQEEKYQKMLKLFRTLKADESARLIDKLDETEAILVLDQLPLKVAAKLVPLLNQPRVVKWARDNLKLN